jgi:methionyl aminopeptidase
VPYDPNKTIHKESTVMTLETEDDLIALKRIGKIVANCLQHMAEQMEPGMTTQELDDCASEYLAQHGAESAPRKVYNFPGTTCISVNEAVAHGIPGPQRLAAGDLVNIDVSAELHGYFADTGASFIVPPVDPLKASICKGAEAALLAAIDAARAGQSLHVIGKSIEKVARKHQLTVIENLGSHGVGRGLHEEPRFIPPVFDPKDRRMLTEHLVITIEPFLSNGARTVDTAADGWTLLTPRPFLAAQYEHTMVITKGKPLVLTLPDRRA